ncbi:Neurobeachin-like protein 1, partial [Frankliniella fusca]
MDKMEVKRDIYQLWLHYKAKNEEEYFRLFVRGFVSVWEEQLPLDWSSPPNWTDIRPDSGPHLSRLPEELLSSVSQFMQEARTETENRTLNCESLSEVELLTHLLTILSRNLDNIPLIASCEYVSISIGIAATVIHQLVEESAHFGEAGVSFFTSVCHLLEVLYDPYFTWHHFLRGNEADFEKIAFQPALLHVEVVPFIYDCFETSLIESYPHLGSQLIHVLGAVVSGAQSIIVQLDPVFPALPSLAESTLVISDKAKEGPVLAKGISKTSSCFCLSDGHNALRAICPATVNMIIAVVGNPATPPELRYHALQCFVLMARVLLKSSPDQRQIEVGTMVQLIRDLLIREVKEGTWTSDSIHALSQIVSAVRALLVWPLPLKKSHAHNISYSHVQALHAHMQQLLLDCQIPDALLFLLNELASKNTEKQSLAEEVVRVFSALLAGSNIVKERLLKADVYTRIAEALRCLGDPKRPLLRALLSLATEENESHSVESENVLKNGHALLLLLRWLPAVPDVDQVWLAENIAKLCNASLQSRVVCSAHQVILEICSLMEQHSSLSRPAVGELLGLLEGLASHCITPLELKSIFLLLREGKPEEKCPYQSQLLHAISAVARRGEHSDCHYFFNIQNDTDGLSVPGIRKWPGAGYGFSFHCWVKLDSEPESKAPSPTSPTSQATSPGSASSPASGQSVLSSMTGTSPSGSHPTSPASSQTSSSRVGVGNKRRQLFNLLTSNNTGVEIFFRADGMLVVAISTKKEFLTATVPDIPLTDNRWHCIGVCITMARRPFGHNQIQVFVDGTQRLSASIKFPSMSEPFTYCTIGSVVQRGAAAPGAGSGGSGDGASVSPRRAPGVLERAAGAGGGLLPSLMNQVPSYLSLPLPLRSSAPLDPNVKSFQAGLQDAVWGAAGCLRGQLGTAALLQDALGPMQARLLFQQGPNWRGLFSSEEGADLSDLVNRLVFCFSPASCWDNLCLDLAPGNKYDGHVLATQCSTLGIKTAVNGIGGIHVVFPILEQAGKGSVGEELSVLPSTQRSGGAATVTASGTGTITATSEELDDWEVLPSSSYADWKLELNPVSGFLSFLRNLLAGSPLNQEQLLRAHGAAILGQLLSQVRPALLDVNVLMVAQLLLEMARDAGSPALLRALHQHVLFNFSIWTRGPFHIRIGHIQYISSVVKEDRKAFRKRYGVQFLLDAIRTHHAAPADLVGADDGRALRLAILRLIRYYISKEVNVKEVAAIVGFLTSVKEETLVMELLEMLILHLEGQCKDQLFLLLFEPHAADLLYCLLIDRRFSMDLKQKVLKLTSVLLRTDRVYDMHKKRLRLQDSTTVLGGLVGGGIGMYPGLIALLGDQKISMEVAAMLLDQVLLTETAASYAGALALLHALSLAELDIKVEVARKILTTLFMRPGAPAAVARQVGWQDCVSRLLVKRPISTAPASASAAEDTSLPDLMTFDDDAFELDGGATASSLIHRSHSPSSVSRISASVSDAASVLESEIKDVAESVTLAIGDNIQYAADNISSFVGSAYSVFRQKTVEMQESLEGLGESAVHRLKHNGAGAVRSGSSLSERPSIDSASASPGTRSRSSSSSEDVSSAAAESSRASLSSTVTDGAAASRRGEDDGGSDAEERREQEALRQWVALDADRQGDREEDLCYLVLNILFTVLWRGVETGSRDCWR